MGKTLHHAVESTPDRVANEYMPSSLAQLLLDRCHVSFERPAIIDAITGETLVGATTATVNQSC